MTTQEVSEMQMVYYEVPVIYIIGYILVVIGLYYSLIYLITKLKPEWMSDDGTDASNKPFTVVLTGMACFLWPFSWIIILPTLFIFGFLYTVIAIGNIAQAKAEVDRLVQDISQNTEHAAGGE